MSLNVSNVRYPYAIGTIGCQAIGASATIEANSSLQDIYDAYKEIFDKYNAMHTALLGQLNHVLEQLDGHPRFYDGKLKLEDIFNDNHIFDEPNLDAGQCKEGAKAYKYYLKDIITQLNALYSWNEKAKNFLEQLELLIQKSSESYIEAHALISQLDIADEHAQEAIKAFTEHAVSKTLTVTKNVVYNDGITDKTDTSTENYQTYESEYDGVLTKSAPDAAEYTYASKLADSYDSLEDLRALTTAKFTVTRTITTTCYKDKTKEDLADKYDDLAYREMVTEENASSSTISAIALFDELPLLDKLKYITVYYKKIEPQEQTNPVSRYVFPEDAKIGFPCVQPKASTSPTDDTNEIGQLEMFYIGYLVDRDGPVNALASFMEVKTVAIKAQIVLLSYRVKALQYYTNLLNKGLEKLNESQAEEQDKLQPIPVVSYNILRYLSANITRSLQYLKDADGNFLEDGEGNALTNPYLVIQYQGDKPGTGEGGYEKNDPNAPYHLTKNNFYVLIEATEEGISSFLNWEPNSTIDVWKCFDKCFTDTTLKYTIGWSNESTVGSSILGDKIAMRTYFTTEPTKENELKINGLTPLPATISSYLDEGVLKETKQIEISRQEIRFIVNVHGKRIATAGITPGKEITIVGNKITIGEDEIVINATECLCDEATGIISFKGGKIDVTGKGYTIAVGEDGTVTTIGGVDIKNNCANSTITETITVEKNPEYQPPSGQEEPPTVTGQYVETTTTFVDPTIDASERNFFLKFDSVNASKAFLSKELEVSRLDVSSLTGDYAGFPWNKPPADKNKYKALWQNFISLWTTQYDTAIANQRSQLEYVQKSINSLRKKIDTFDSMSSNFRSKAYTIYNKIVNKVN